MHCEGKMVSLERAHHKATDAAAVVHPQEDFTT